VRTANIPPPPSPNTVCPPGQKYTGQVLSLRRIALCTLAFAPGPAVNALYPPEEWLIETGAPPVKAWYTIHRMAYEKGFIRDSFIGPCRVMFFDLADVVGLYREELIHHPYKLYGMEG
jgi:hypothetical protein